MADLKDKKCYLKCLKNLHEPIVLPHKTTVILGRSKRLLISDKECSRHQLELTADCSRNFVTVKRCGANPSQIDSIDIDHNKSERMAMGQILSIINMKYPHECEFLEEGENLDKKEGLKRSIENSPPKVANETVDSVNNLTQTNIKKAKKTGHWSTGLKYAKSDPENVVFENDEIVVIKDKYPKAECHWLVMPSADISNLSALNSSHCELLENMLKVGKEIANKYGEDREFRFGYHAVPSMSCLHMHVISQDFNSVCFKTKKHWNSFTSEYFVEATEIINELKTNGCIKNRKELTACLNNPLKCHRCYKQIKNIPALKQHIKTCKAG